MKALEHIDLTIPPARPSRSWARPERASRRSPSSSPASTTPLRARDSSTATTCATCPATRCARRWDRAPGGVPVQRHRRREHRLRPARRRREIGSPRRRRRARVHLRAPRATTPRSASAARSSPPASASSSLRARADRRPARPHPRRGDLKRRPPHRGPHRIRPAASLAAAPRSWSLTGSPRSATPDDRRPGARPHHRAGEPRGADRLRGRYCGLYRDWATQAAA